MQDWLTAAASARPDHEAIAVDGRSVSFAELDELATARARTLPAGRAIVVDPPGLAFAEQLHAAPRAGAVFEPRAPGEPAPQPGVGREELRFEHDPEEIHSVIHTSGTTGARKAVELTFANHAASALASANALGVDPGDRWLCPLPLHHVGGLNVLIRSVINQTTVVLHERFVAERVKAELESGAVTLASLVPTMLARLRAAGLRRAPGVRAIALGGGPIPAELLGWAGEAGLPVVPVYGMTETCSQIVAGSPGRALHGVELEIASDGEILVRGPMVARGELSADGWLHTGDLGRLDAEGRLQVLGRLKELIVTGGENVAPLEVEQALLAHPAVVDAGVTGLPDPDWGEAVTAFVVLRAPAGDLREWCRARLEAFKVPKAVHVVDKLPRNSGGKLMRDRLGA
jgi:O-succinylbenzoic acid--CoA ligase